MNGKIRITSTMADALLEPARQAILSYEPGQRHERLMGIAPSDPLSGRYARWFKVGERQAIAAANQTLCQIAEPLTKSEVLAHLTKLAATNEQVESQARLRGTDSDPLVAEQEVRLYLAGWAHGTQLAWSSVYGMIDAYQKVEAAAKCIIKTALTVTITGNLVTMLLDGNGTWQISSVDGRFRVVFNTMNYVFSAEDGQTKLLRSGRVHSFGLGIRNWYVIIDPIRTEGS